jgi:uroporphyrinogen III methyltransferase/synthase
LDDIAARAKNKKIRPPAIVIVGQVVNSERKLDWLKKSRKILFTGLSKERFFTKGFYIHLPLIKIAPLGSYKEFDAHLKNLGEFDWLVFTSRYGVKYFFERLRSVGLDSRSLCGAQIAVIGNSTKNALLERGIITDLVPEEESSTGLLKKLKTIDLKDKKIFLPRSDLSDKGLTDGLKRMGARVTASVAYTNEMPENLPDLELGSFDEVMFTSPSGVRNFMKRYGPVPEGVKVSCIGEVTEREAMRCRLLD